MSEAWRDTRHVETRCPSCNHRLDAAGSPDGHTPLPGDFSVCISCASPLVYIDDLRLRPATPAELAALEPAQRETLSRYQAMVRALNRREMRND